MKATSIAIKLILALVVLALLGQGTVVSGAELSRNGGTPLNQASLSLPRPTRGPAGNVVEWDSTSAFMANVPAQAQSGVVAVASGMLHLLALREDGTVVAWGSNGYGQLNVPAGLSDVVAIAAGGFHNLALKSNGTVVAWGSNGYGQLDVPAGLSDVVAIAAGSNHSLALKSDGTLVAWGENTKGQASLPGGVSNAVAIAARGDHNLALRSDGTVVAWGENANGQCSVPAGLSDVVAVSAGMVHSLALRSNGSVVSWGGAPSVPTEAQSGVVAISAGYTHDLALRSDGAVVAWGYVGAGNATVPWGLNGVVAISGGFNLSLALRIPPTATTVAWGQDDYSQATVPSAYETGLVAVSAGGFHSLGLKNDGTVVAWGRNIDGQAAPPSGLSSVVAVSAGGYHSLALKSNGTVVAWGKNDFGQASVPAGLSDVVAIAAGDQHSVALKRDGTVVAWGGTNDLVRGVPADLVDVTAIAAGGSHSLALKSNGTVVAWGSNDKGQATVPASLWGAAAIGAGESHSIALTKDGSVVSWGDTTTSQSNMVAIGAGGYHDLALRSDGRVIAWNSDGSSRTDVPAGASSGVVSIDAGIYHNLALRVGAVPSPVSEVTSTTASGSYGAGVVVDIDVRFNQVVTVTGAPRLLLAVGRVGAAATYVGGSGTNTLTFRYTVQAGDTSADLDYASKTALQLNGGSIRDSQGVNLGLTLPAPGAAGSLSANASIVIDSTPPVVRLTAPANGERIVCQEFVCQATPTYRGVAGTAVGDLREVTVRVYKDIKINPGYELPDLTAAVQPDGTYSVVAPSPLDPWSYTVQVEQKDAAGNTTLTAPITFKVSPPTPVITGVSPASLSVDATDLTVTLTGEGFVSGACVLWDEPGATQPTFLCPDKNSITATELKFTAPALTEPMTVELWVYNPIFGNSYPLPLVITPSGTSVVASSTAWVTDGTTATAAISGVITATGHNIGMVSVAQYSGNPVGAPGFPVTGPYVGVYLNTSNNIRWIDVSVCDSNYTSAATLHWWDPTANGGTGAWRQVSPAAGFDSASKCLTFTAYRMNYFGPISTPTTEQLTGTVFVVSDTGPSACVTTNDGSWSDPTIWQGCSGKAPTAAENVWVRNTVTLTQAEAARSITLADAGNGDSGVGSIELSGNILTLSGDLVDDSSASHAIKDSSVPGDPSASAGKLVFAGASPQVISSSTKADGAETVIAANLEAQQPVVARRPVRVGGDLALTSQGSVEIAGHAAKGDPTSIVDSRLSLEADLIDNVSDDGSREAIKSTDGTVSFEGNTTSGREIRSATKTAETRIGAKVMIKRPLKLLKDVRIQQDLSVEVGGQLDVADKVAALEKDLVDNSSLDAEAITSSDSAKAGKARFEGSAEQKIRTDSKADETKIGVKVEAEQQVKLEKALRLKEQISLIDKLVDGKSTQQGRIDVAGNALSLEKDLVDDSSAQEAIVDSLADLSNPSAGIGKISFVGLGAQRISSSAKGDGIETRIAANLEAQQSLRAERKLRILGNLTLTNNGSLAMAGHLRSGSLTEMVDRDLFLEADLIDNAPDDGSREAISTDGIVSFEGLNVAEQLIRSDGKTQDTRIGAKVNVKRPADKVLKIAKALEVKGNLTLDSGHRGRILLNKALILRKDLIDNRPDTDADGQPVEQDAIEQDPDDVTKQAEVNFEDKEDSSAQDQAVKSDTGRTKPTILPTVRVKKLSGIVLKVVKPLEVKGDLKLDANHSGRISLKKRLTLRRDLIDNRPETNEQDAIEQSKDTDTDLNEAEVSFEDKNEASSADQEIRSDSRRTLPTNIARVRVAKGFGKKLMVRTQTQMREASFEGSSDQAVELSAKADVHIVGTLGKAVFTQRSFTGYDVKDHDTQTKISTKLKNALVSAFLKLGKKLGVHKGSMELEVAPSDCEGSDPCEASTDSIDVQVGSETIAMVPDILVTMPNGSAGTIDEPVENKITVQAVSGSPLSAAVGSDVDLTVPVGATAEITEPVPGQFVVTNVIGSTANIAVAVGGNAQLPVQPGDSADTVAPTVTITGPDAGTIYDLGTVISFTGTFADPGRADTHSAQWTFDALGTQGTVTETSGGGSVAGSYTFTAPGTYHVRLTVADSDGNQGSATTIGGEDATIVVSKASQTSAFDAPASPAVYGSTFHVNPTASSKLAVMLAASGACSAIQPSTGGYDVTITSGTGACILIASQAGDDYYSPAAEVKQEVSAAKASPSITWLNPGPIVYGTPLDATQLNASVTGVDGHTLAGTLVYSPAAGTALGAGNGQSLKVDFAPLDAINYESASKTVSIDVGKADAKIDVTPYTVTYDGSAHTASGTATGVKGESLSGLNLGGTTHTDAGDYPADAWTFTDVTGNYKDASGTVSVSIAKADATITVNPYTGAYDGNAHGATGSATGAKGEPLSGLSLGASFTNVPGGTAAWTFTDVTGNYKDASGTVSVSIAKANATITVTPYSVTFDGSSHTATGSSKGVKGEALAGLNLGGTTHTNAGDYTDTWTFADSTGNYNNASGTVRDSIVKATSTVTVSCPSNVTYDGTAKTPCTASVAGVGGLNKALTVLYSNNTSAGTATASASWSGDANHQDSSSSAQFTINQASATILYTGTEVYILGSTASTNTWSITATVSPSVCASAYSLDRNPITQAAGPYLISTSIKPTTDWGVGVYALTATTTNTNCIASSDDATLTIGSQGDSANGGGWTTLPSFGRLNFGFTVQKVDSKCTTSCAYKGQFVMVNNGKWRLKGILSTYAKTTTTSGSASGTGDLYKWDQTLNGGLGGWALQQSGVSFTISFTDNGTNLKTKPDLFGQRITYVDPTIPSFAPAAIKGGNLTVK